MEKKKAKTKMLESFRRPDDKIGYEAAQMHTFSEPFQYTTAAAALESAWGLHNKPKKKWCSITQMVSEAFWRTANGELKNVV